MKRGTVRPVPISSPGGGGSGTMVRIGKLSAVGVTKAKGPPVLHDGGGLYLRVAPNR